MDFSSEAVRLGRESESEDPDHHDHKMHWIQADLCSWAQVSNSILPLAPFDMILDKSTSDAIATSEPRTFFRLAGNNNNNENDDNICPILRDLLSSRDSSHLNLFKGADDNDEEEEEEEEGKSLTLSPVDLLSIHLTSLARKGTIWLVLSYSSIRFDGLPCLSMYWDVVSRTPLKAPAGKAASATAMVPDVFHWVYVLRRK